jgi:hypothetical protein
MENILNTEQESFKSKLLNHVKCYHKNIIGLEELPVKTLLTYTHPIDRLDFKLEYKDLYNENPNYSPSV